MFNLILLQACSNMAATEGSTQQNGWSMWVMLGLMFIIFYFFMIRPQKKKQQELQKQRESMKKGDKVVTAGGIYGIIKEIQETTMLIEIDKEVCMKVDKGSIYLILDDARKENQELDKKQ